MRRENLLESEVAKGLSQVGPLNVMLDDFTSLFHEFPIRNARRASRLASSTIETGGNVLDKAFRKWHDPAFVGSH